MAKSPDASDPGVELTVSTGQFGVVAVDTFEALADRIAQELCANLNRQVLE